MASSLPPLLTISQVLALAPDSWINDGFTAYVANIERKDYKDKKTGAARFMFKLSLADPATQQTVNSTSFTVPRFAVGQTIEATGQGMKFKSSAQYGPEISIGDKAMIAVVNGAAPAGAATPPPAHQPSQHYDSNPPGRPGGAPDRSSSPAHQNNLGLPVIYGATVGMAVKEALPLVCAEFGGITPNDDGTGFLAGKPFWKRVYQVASDIIYVCQQLEQGKLATRLAPADPDHHPDLEPAAAPVAPPARQAAPASYAPRARATEAQMANQRPSTPEEDDDVPF